MALENDTQAPDFSLINQYGETISLSQFRGVKSVALVFFPLAFSGICSSELCELRDNLGLFADGGVELIGISVDSRHALRAWGEQEGYNFSLVADFWPHGGVAKEYGVFLEEKGFANRAPVCPLPAALPQARVRDHLRPPLQRQHDAWMRDHMSQQSTDANMDHIGRICNLGFGSSLIRDEIGHQR